MSDIERTNDVGKLIEMYRQCIEDAFKVSRQLERQNIERPWITVEYEVSRGEYYHEFTSANIDVCSDRKFLMRKRIRLEIR